MSQAVKTQSEGWNRRQIIAGLAGGLTLQLTVDARAQVPVKTKARIVIAGAGTAGLTVASRLARGLDGAEITIVDPRFDHWYQPGLTLVGAGVKPASYVMLRTSDFVPSSVRWLRESVAEFDPVANRVITDKGMKVEYDFLVVATGLVLDYQAIQGMHPGLIGRDGVASVYAGPEAAEASWRVLENFKKRGEIGLFGRPATEMKCAGAPLKQTFIADDYLRSNNTRNRSEIIYNAHNDALFSVPLVDTKVRELFARQQIKSNFGHVLTAIDPARRMATYATAKGPVELKWDFINVIPPMRAPRLCAVRPCRGRAAISRPMDGSKSTGRRCVMHAFPTSSGWATSTAFPRARRPQA